MKHAGAQALDRLEPLLEKIRAVRTLKEKSRGVFYRRSRAFLHFHEDRAGIFADIRAEDGEGFDRLKVDEAAGAEALIARVSELTAQVGTHD